MSKTKLFNVSIVAVLFSTLKLNLAVQLHGSFTPRAQVIRCFYALIPLWVDEIFKIWNSILKETILPHIQQSVT